MKASNGMYLFYILCIFVKILPDDDHNSWNIEHNYAETGCFYSNSIFVLDCNCLLTI